MKIQSNPDLHLTYCLNIHPGEALSDVVASIKTHAARVRDQVSHEGPFGLGIRLGAAAVDEMDASAVSELKCLLEQENMYVFTVNGFPYGDFHGTRVKEDVYAPDWRTTERREYTRRLVAILGELLPEGVEGSISTVPVSYAPWMEREDSIDDALQQLMGVVQDCVKLEQESGRKIAVALEPEPDCYVQTVEGAVDFFNNHLLTRGVSMLASATGMSAGECEVAVRRHLGVCVDTCHSAVQFEDPVESLARLEMEGIAISKVQMSSAISTVLSAESRKSLAGFVDEVYLHQTRVRGQDGAISAYTDLDHDLLAGLDDGSELRTHFHVPLWFEGRDGLAGTVSAIPDSFFSRLKSGVTPHIEVETYTFDVLPAELRGVDVVESVVKELDWVRRKLA